MQTARLTSEQKLEAGEKLAGKYALVRRLAVGGMGQIWVAHNVLTDADVALKVLRGDADEKMQAELRFRHEARLGAMLGHRNIVRVFDFIEEAGGGLILVLELLRGETLYRRLKSGKISPAEAVAITLPVLSALDHAHEMGVIHRDLKPANIFLAVDPDGHVTPKLLDFGIAKLPMAGVQTLDGRVLGTPRYMSPEQIRSDPKIDGRSDLFTIGVLLVEMLTGVSPFKATSASASLAAVLEQQLDPDPSVDPKLWLVLQRALAKRAYERFATAGEFATALRAAVPETDAELASTMRREKQQLSRKTSGPDSGDQSGPILDSDESDAPSVSRRESSVPVVAGLEARSPATKKNWLIGALVGFALLVGLVATAMRSKPEPVKVVASPPAMTSPAADTFPPPVPPSTASSELVSTSQSASPPVRPAWSKPRIPPKKKPVATTPGF